MNSIVSLQGEILPHFSTEPLCLLPAYYPFNKNNSLFAKHSTAVYAAQGGNSVFLLINAQLSIYLFLIYSCELFLHIDVMLWDSEDKHNIWIPECQKDFNIVCSDSVDISFVCPSACFPQCNIIDSSLQHIFFLNYFFHTRIPFLSSDQIFQLLWNN